MNDSRVASPVALVPSTARWQPTRAGLVSIWRYWDEVFTFHRGRLLLRGPNGSGKSLALELLLPFLLDANASPDRLTSAGKSRGGLFDRVMTGTDETTRTGFAWVEFRRDDEVFTIGARIRASRSTHRAEPDYFTTTLAVGEGLHLLDANRVALSRQALVEALGDTGRVHASGEEHRAAVREVLYPGFSADRYSSVIGALLTLRKEKLSQQLGNVKELSDVLSEALPAVDDHDITAVAEGFERLDRRRSELLALESEVRSVHLLADRQRDYARSIILGGAHQVRSAETRRDDVTKAERQAGERLEAVQGELQRSEGQLQQGEARFEKLGEHVEALKESEAYKSGQALADLKAHARQLARVAEQQGETARWAREDHEQAVKDVSSAADDRAEAEANLGGAARELLAAGRAVGADAVLSQVEVGDAADLSEVADVGAAAGVGADEGERLIGAWVGARRQLMAEVRSALTDHEQAVLRREVIEGQIETAATDWSDRQGEHEAGRSALARAAADYQSAVSAWASGCSVIGPDRVLGAVPAGADDPEEVEAGIASLQSEIEVELAVAGRDLTAEREALEEARRDVLAERSRWEQSVLPDPEAPSWRSARNGLTGAPFWSVVDPVAGARPEDVDGLEAALTGAGLLDAWVAPDGSVVLTDGRVDLVLGAGTLGAGVLGASGGGGGGGRGPVGSSLGSLLAPAPDAAVPADTVARILSSIPLVATTRAVGAGADWAGPEVAIGRDGTYRLASAVGRGPDRPAQVLGAPARERHRQARLAELDAGLADLGVQVAEIDRRQEDLRRRSEAIHAELATAPDGVPVREAVRELADAAIRLGAATDQLQKLRVELSQAEDEVRSALKRLTTLGASHGLPTERAELDRLEEALRKLESAVVTWARRKREEARAALQHRQAGERAERADTAAERARLDHEGSEAEARRQADRVAVLESSVGADYRDVLARIQALGDERSDLRDRLPGLREESAKLQRQLGELEQVVRDAVEARRQAEAERDASHRELVTMADDLAADASIEGFEGLEGVSAILGFARRVLAEHGQVRYERDVIDRLSERVNDQVHQAGTALGSRVDVDREQAGHWWCLRTMSGGRRRRAVELADALAGELEQGRAELAAEEERLFEQTLAGSVRRALADRIRQANALVDAINDQLDAVRTAAAGVGVRLQWSVDPEQLEAVKAARALLLRDPADLSEEERASLQAFVRARVDQARAELEHNAPWEARLRETLDYRRWHRFTLQIAHRDWDGYEPATARRLQRLSTGERSMALHLPMIASVAAHYSGEMDQASVCPRLILLDELFAGVDTANRAQLFGTFRTWDLDAVFTSDHEWCQYASLDGIAIHQLHPGGPDEPVTSTRFTWDGHERRIDPVVNAA